MFSFHVMLHNTFIYTELFPVSSCVCLLASASCSITRYDQEILAQRSQQQGHHCPDKDRFSSHVRQVLIQGCKLDHNTLPQNSSMAALIGTPSLPSKKSHILNPVYITDR